MTWDDVLTILPFSLVVASALLVILVDLFWPRRDPLVMAVGLGGLVLALVASFAIGPLPSGVGLLARAGHDRRSVALHARPLHRPHGRRPHPHRAADAALRAGLPGSAEAATGRVHGHAPLRGQRRHAHRRRTGPAHPLPGPGAAGAAGLPAGRLRQAGRPLHRGRHQVLPAGIVLQRHPPLWPGLRAGLHGLHAAHSHRGPAVGDRRWQPAAAAGAGHGPGPAGGGGALQDRRRALPLLDTGRLPGLADAGHRLPLHRPQDRRLRAASCASSSRL